MFGTTSSIMSVSGWSLMEGVGNKYYNQAEKFVMGSHAKCHHNTFTGYCNGLMGGSLVNAEWEDNYFHMLGNYEKGNTGHIRANGNIMFHSGEATERVEKVVFRNNTFKNWYYMNNSINFKYKLSNRVDISNNRFIDNTGVDRLDKDFVITLHDEETINFGTLTHSALIKSFDLDWDCYLILVRNSGGVLTPNEILAGRKALQSIHDHGLRDDIQYLYPFLGDSKSSRVPLLGWHNTIYKSFPLNTLTEESYTKEIGWKGDGFSNGLLVQGTEIDHTSYGLFTQITSIESLTVTGDNYYLGYYTGGASSTTHIKYNSSRELSGMGGGLIKNNFDQETGFVLSAQEGSSQINYLDTPTYSDYSNQNLGSIQTTANNLRLLSAGTTRYSDAGLGSVGVTKLMSLDKTKILRSIIGQLMLDLGRPAQRATFELPAIPTEDTIVATGSPTPITNVWAGTQAEYDAIVTKDVNTIYYTTA